MNWWKIVATGVVAGVAATAAMSLFQAAAAPALGQDSDAEPANEQAADSASRLVTGTAVAEPHKEVAGNLVHYATGIALGVGYAAAVAYRPTTARGFGVPFGLGVALVLDDLAVPAFGWGNPPWQTDATTHAYGLGSHAVFGAALEGSRRMAVAAVDTLD